MLDDEKERKKCLEVVEESRERVDKTVHKVLFIKKKSFKIFNFTFCH